jgi:hypothetical protein
MRLNQKIQSKRSIGFNFLLVSNPQQGSTLSKKEKKKMGMLDVEFY